MGSAFARYCDAENREFTIIDRQNYHEFVGQSCEVLINAYGNSKKFLAQQDPLQDFDASVRSARASLINFKCGLYVYLSSCDVYPDCSSPRTTSEEQSLDPTKQSPYGFHKFLAEQCVQHAARRWLIVRFGGFVGPGLKKNPIFDILKGGPLWLDPESELQFMHTDQAAKIVFSLIDHGLSQEIFNICGKELVQLREVIAWTGWQVPVQPDSPKVRYEVDLSKISRFTEIPESRSTVLAFVHEQLKSQRT